MILAVTSPFRNEKWSSALCQCKAQKNMAAKETLITTQAGYHVEKPGHCRLLMNAEWWGCYEARAEVHKSLGNMCPPSRKRESQKTPNTRSPETTSPNTENLRAKAPPTRICPGCLCSANRSGNIGREWLGALGLRPPTVDLHLLVMPRRRAKPQFPQVGTSAVLFVEQ